MIELPADLGQRILDAARIAVAIHQEQAAREEMKQATAGGAGTGAYRNLPGGDIDLEIELAPQLREMQL